MKYSKPCFALGLSLALGLGVLGGCTSSDQKDTVTPTPEITQGYDNPPTLEETQEEGQGDTWVIERPAGTDSVTHDLGGASVSLPNDMVSMTEDLGAPEGVQVFAVEVSGEDASRPDVPVENLYAMSMPLAERFATLDPEATKELDDDLDRLAYAVVYEAKVAFGQATDFVSGPVEDAQGTVIGQYVTFMSNGERLTRMEILRENDVLMLSSTITGEVDAPDYLRTLTLV